MNGADRAGRAFEEAIGALSLIDHHVHGAFRVPLDRIAFERSVTESDRAIGPGATSFDSQLGSAILRWCAPVLELPPHVSPEEYLARRAELGPEETNRRLLGSSGVSHYLVDTGFVRTGVLATAVTAEDRRRGSRRSARTADSPYPGSPA